MTTDKKDRIPNAPDKGLVPKLRFPEFVDEWKVKRLGDDCEIQMCKRIFANQTSEIGDVPFYKIGTIGGSADAFISKELFSEYKAKYNFPQKGEVLITCAGTVGKTVIYDGEDAYYQDSNIVWISNPRQYYTNAFLQRVLSRIDWSKLNTTTIVRIYNDNLRDLKIAYPSIVEQGKISSLLGLIDERITTQSRAIEKYESLINGLQESILWKDYKRVSFSEIFIERNERTNVANQYEVLSSTIKGIFRQSDYFDKEVASVNNVGYKVLYKGDIVLSPQNLWLGNINYNDSFEIGMVSPSYKVFYINDTYNPFYISCFLKTHKALYEYACASEQGASIVRRNLDLDAFKAISIPIPSIEVQNRIAKVFSLLYQKHKTEIQILEKLNKQKEHLLSQMFI